MAFSWFAVSFGLPELDWQLTSTIVQARTTLRTSLLFSKLADASNFETSEIGLFMVGSFSSIPRVGFTSAFGVSTT